MLVRIEQVRNTDTVLVIDEVSKYLGQMYFSDFSECIVNKDPMVEDDYLFWYVEKEQINKFLKK